MEKEAREKYKRAKKLEIMKREKEIEAAIRRHAEKNPGGVSESYKMKWLTIIKLTKCKLIIVSHFIL